MIIASYVDPTKGIKILLVLFASSATGDADSMSMLVPMCTILLAVIFEGIRSCGSCALEHNAPLLCSALLQKYLILSHSQLSLEYAAKLWPLPGYLNSDSVFIL